MQRKINVITSLNPTDLKINPELEALGIAQIPLRPNSKKPFSPTWKTSAPAEQWRGAPSDANIGYIPSGKYIAIDADDLETAAIVARRLEGLGYPWIQTITPRGSHFWIRSTAPEGFGVGKLLEGTGELRARRCYLAEPQSIIDGRSYTWVTAPNFAALPLLEWSNVSQLVAPRVTVEELDAPPFPLFKRDPSGKFLALLAELRTAAKGEPVDRYSTRSEALAGAMGSFISRGYSFDEILEFFERIAPANYIHKGLGRKQWLRAEYRGALAWLRGSPQRREIESLYRLANSLPWPGRTGLYDRGVLKAVYSLAWQAGTLQPRARVRDVALFFSIQPLTASHSFRRLAASGWLQPIGCGTFQLLLPQPLEPLTPPPVSSVSVEIQTGEGDAETWGKMGKTSEAVYSLLGSEPRGIPSLVESTGKRRLTIYRALERLQAFDLAERSGKGWVRGSGSLAAAGSMLGAPEAGRIRRRVIERQRQAFREWKAGKKAPGRAVEYPGS